MHISDFSKKRILQAFIEKALKYGGNPKEVFAWCEKLENHLSNHEWKTIPNNTVKKMLLLCITGGTNRR